MEKKGEYEKYAFIVGIIAIIILMFLIVKPVITSLLGGVMLAFIFHPFYNWIKKWIKNETASAFATLFIILIIIIVPLGFIANSLVKEAGVLVNYSKALSLPENTECTHPAACEFAKWFKDFSANSKLDDSLRSFLTQISQQFATFATRMLSSFPLKFLQFFIILFSTFVFLRDGRKIFSDYRKYIPLTNQHKDHFVKRFKEISYAVIYGTIVVAMAQSILATIGFFIFNVKAPIFWGIVVFIMSILPMMAPPLVYLPLALFKVVNGLGLGDSKSIFNGIMLAVYGIAIVSTVDNFIRYKITGDKGKVSPLLVLVGIIGGVQLLGVVGIFFGPLILVFGLTMLEIVGER